MLHFKFHFIFFTSRDAFLKCFAYSREISFWDNSFFLRVLSVYLVFDITNISTIFYEVCHTICAFSDNIYNDDNNIMFYLYSTFQNPRTRYIKLIDNMNTNTNTNIVT